MLESASVGAALLVVARRGHGELVGLLLGSVSEHCMTHAHCPVLVYRDDCGAIARGLSLGLPFITFPRHRSGGWGRTEQWCERPRRDRYRTPTKAVHPSNGGRAHLYR